MPGVVKNELYTPVITTSGGPKDDEGGIHSTSHCTPGAISVKSCGPMTVRGDIDGNPVIWKMDTGAKRTFISTETYDGLTEKPVLSPVKMKFHAAEGSMLTCLGESVMQLTFGDTIYDFPVVVAEVNTNLLGEDFITQFRCNWDHDEGCLIINGSRRPFSGTRNTQSGRVISLETVEVPAGCEAIIKSSVTNNHPWNMKTSTPGILTPEKRFMERYGIAIARTLVDFDGSIILTRVLNLGNSAVTIFKNMHMALFTPVSRIKELYLDTGSVSHIHSSREETELPEHLVSMFEEGCVGLNNEQRVEFKQFLLRNKMSFARPGEVGRTHMGTHKIKLRDETPIKEPPRRIPIHKREILDKEIEKLEKRGLIEKSTSPWSSQLVLVQKKDGSWRMCVDYRKLNERTIKDAYPITRIDDNLDALSGADWFTSLDLDMAYHQVPMEDGDKEKTAFATPRGGLYHYVTMPFGLCNSPGTFQRVMEKVLAGLQWQVAVLYLDDIIVYGRTFEEHFTNLETVLERINNAGLKLKPTKCHFLRKETKFLGHIVSKQGVRTDPDKTSAVENMPTPKSLRDVRSFLGLTSYYRKFIKDYATTAQPLFDLTKKDTKFCWTADTEKAFHELKKKLTGSEVLAYPDINGTEFILDTDASHYAIGGVLSQVQNGKERVISYGSRSLTRAERNYCVTRKEMLAVVYFTKHFKHYLIGKPCIVRTDHGSLTWLQRFKEPDGQIHRWLQQLSQFDMKIMHRPGRKHGNADALSRLCNTDQGTCKQCNMPWDFVYQEPNTQEQDDQMVNPKQTEISTDKSIFTTESGLQIHIYQGNIRRVNVDAIISSANEHLTNGAGVAKVIAEAAGIDLTRECDNYLRTHKNLPETKVCTTTAGRLPYHGVIHCVGPRWVDYKDDRKDVCVTNLKTTILNVAREADQKGFPRIAMPTISSGLFGVPKEICAKAYLDGLLYFSAESKDKLKEVHIVDINHDMVELVKETFSQYFDERRAVQPTFAIDPSTMFEGSEGDDSQNEEETPGDVRLRRGRKPNRPPVAVTRQPPTNDLTLDVLSKRQQADEIIGEIYRLKSAQTEKPIWTDISPKSPELKYWIGKWDILDIQNNVLCIKWYQSDRDVRWRVCIPDDMTNEIMWHIHDAPTSGHFGITKTLEKAKMCPYYWRNMSTTVQDYVSSCEICGEYKNPPNSKRHAMKSYVMGGPFERVATDIAGPFPTTEYNNRYILVVKDYFTKFTEIYPMVDMQAETVTDIIVKCWVARYGCPLEIHSDQGRQYESAIFTEMCKLLGIHKSRTTPLHPRSDGMVERMNRSIQDILAKYVKRNQKNWDTCLPFVAMAYNSTPHSGTGISPRRMIFGREMVLPLDVMTEPPVTDPGVQNETEYVMGLQQNIREIHRLAREQLNKEAKRQKRQYDTRVKAREYKVGQLVWRYQPNNTPGRKPKISRHWTGPWVITEKYGDVLFCIQCKDTAPGVIIHGDNLKLYNGKKTLPWYKGPKDNATTTTLFRDVTLDSGENSSDNADERSVEGQAKNDRPIGETPDKAIGRNTPLRDVGAGTSIRPRDDPIGRPRFSRTRRINLPSRYR